MDDLPTRIFAKACGILLGNKQYEGIVVKVDDKFWSVAIKEDQIVINALSNNTSLLDGALLTYHDTEEDAIIAAACDLKGKYLEL